MYNLEHKNMSNFIPKIGIFQELLISEGIHRNQVSQLFLLVQTLLYLKKTWPKIAQKITISILLEE